MITRIFSIIAILISSVALGVSYYIVIRDPLGTGVGKYDFSTPRSALESKMKITINNDIKAAIQLEGWFGDKTQREQLDTLEVRKESEFRGMKILFIAYKNKGITRYDTRGFEKDASTGYWIPTYASPSEVEKDDKALAAEMKDFKDMGELRPSR